MKNLIIASLALTAAAAITPATQAQEALTTTVKYADLDLSRSEGAAVLYQRIVIAANAVCAPFDDRARGLQYRSMYDHCIGRATQNAVDKVDAPTLSAYAAAKGVSVPVRLAAR